MELNKDQKKTLIIIGVLIIILGAISFWHRPDYYYKDTTDYAKVNQGLNEQAYKKYLASLKIDPVASRAVFQKLFTEDDIKREVEKVLQTNQKIEMPAAGAFNIKVSGNTGQQALADYLKEAATISWVFKNRTAEYNQLLFAKDKQASVDLITETRKQAGKLQDLAVPKEAVDLQTGQLSALLAYQQLAELSQTYALGQSGDPWANMYKQYAVINESLRNYNTELLRLSDKYKITEMPFELHYAEGAEEDNGFGLIPKARAVFGVGDMSITIGDIPRIIRESLQDGLESSFAQFMGSFIQKLLAKIESNYLISNFLYYSDALVSGEYADDYLNKYVSDSFDRNMVKKMLPQFKCGQKEENLRKVFESKAQSYLGFDPRGLDPKDPNFNAKLSRVGDFLAQPEGWQLYYQDLAKLTQSEAEKAAALELTSSGLKSPRDIGQSSINLSVSAIVSAQRAALSAAMNLGVSTAKNFISQFVSSMVQTLTNQFVFRGATSVRGGTAIGVLKEQSTCLAAAQVQAIVPLENTAITPPPPAPTEEELLKQQCAKYPETCKK